MENVERINKKLERTLTVGELIEILKTCADDACVAFSSDYGDHCHTEQLHLITG